MSDNSLVVSASTSESKKARELVELLSKMGQGTKETDIETIETLDEANTILNQSINQQILDRMMERICDGAILGSADEYHNLSITLSRKNKPYQAMLVCKAGLKTWLHNVDLNADVIRYAMDAGKVKEASEFVISFFKNCPDKNKWNWRGFSFLLDYYMDAMPDGYGQSITELIADYKKYLPHEEKAYVIEAQFQIDEGLKKDAIDTLEHAITNLCAPQSAIMLADIYMDQGRYPDVVRVASLGIAYSAEVQPSIRTAYLIMLRALAKDAMYLRESYASNTYSVNEAKQIISEYKLAEKYVNPREKENIQLRMAILQTFAGL